MQSYCCIQKKVLFHSGILFILSIYKEDSNFLFNVLMLYPNHSHFCFFCFFKLYFISLKEIDIEFDFSIITFLTYDILKAMRIEINVDFKLLHFNLILLSYGFGYKKSFKDISMFNFFFFFCFSYSLL